MTGMKEGAGEDPFAEDPEEEEEETVEEPASEEQDRAVEEPSPSASDQSDGSEQSGQRNIQIPYKFRRDGVQDGRERVPLFLKEDTKTAERDSLRHLEEQLGDDVAITDLREAVVKVGLANLEAVESELREWGYGMTFDN